jgi:hypothetical protein
MKLLKVNSVKIGDKEINFYSPVTINAIERPFHHGMFLHLPSQRAAHASVLLSIPQAKAVLESLGKVS